MVHCGGGSPKYFLGKTPVFAHQSELLTIFCRKFTAIYPGFDFGQMLATAGQNIEQLELELRTTLLGKMAGQVRF